MAERWDTGHEIMTTISVSQCKLYYRNHKNCGSLVESFLEFITHYLFNQIISPFLVGSNPLAIFSHSASVDQIGKTFAISGK